MNLSANDKLNLLAVKQNKQPKQPTTKVSITESLENVSGVAQRSVRLRHSDSIGQDKLDYIADEVPIAFAYNGQSHAVMMASPLDLRDFAIGFSLTERIIDSIDDIIDIDIRKAAKGITIQLQIKAHLVKRLESQRRQLSGRSGCGICGITDIAAAVPDLDPLTRSPIPGHDVINNAVQTLQENQVLQNDCGAVHGAGLFTQSGDLLGLREDVGRHNALDKLIGSQVNNLKGTHFVLMSSRASHELVNKTVIAGVGTLVAISAATTLAIEYAERTNLNLLGFIRGSRQVIYTTNNSE